MKAMPCSVKDKVIFFVMIIIFIEMIKK